MLRHAHLAAVLLLTLFAGSCRDAVSYSIKVVQTKEHDGFWLPAMRASGILWQDGGNPIVFPGGAVWSFGDSFMGEAKPGGELKVKGAVTNTALLYEGPNSVKYLSSARLSDGAMLPLQPPETWKTTRIWPAGGIFINGGFYVYYSVVKLVKTGMGFEDADIWGLAKSSGTDWKRWERVSFHQPLAFKQAPQSVLEGKDGYVYAYYLEKDGFTSVVKAAKFKPQDIANPAAYQFSSKTLAKNVFGQVSVAWNSYLQLYVMCHNGDLFKEPRTIYLRFAKNPQGPFSQPVKVFEKPGEIGPEKMEGIFYCAYLHPEISDGTPG
ncbi:MAG TPA: DUF4185 domain-containing protein, partial [Elusimicrobiales bacterium]|nr:DUF4185 domain-containing protein [Elusimicrobiales bacterium]